MVDDEVRTNHRLRNNDVDAPYDVASMSSTLSTSVSRPSFNSMPVGHDFTLWPHTMTRPQVDRMASRASRMGRRVPRAAHAPDANKLLVGDGSRAARDAVSDLTRLARSFARQYGLLFSVMRTLDVDTDAVTAAIRDTADARDDVSVSSVASFHSHTGGSTPQSLARLPEKERLFAAALLAMHIAMHQINDANVRVVHKSRELSATATDPSVTLKDIQSLISAQHEGFLPGSNLTGSERIALDKAIETRLSIARASMQIKALNSASKSSASASRPSSNANNARSRNPSRPRRSNTAGAATRQGESSASAPRGRADE